MSAARIDPELEPAIAGRQPPVDPVADPRRARAALLEALGEPAPSHPDVERRDELVQGADGHHIPVRVYRPRRARPDAPGLVWMHGGGFVLGDIRMEDQTCDAIAARYGCVVCSVGYRLAPEHPYPAGIEDCYAALGWIVAQASGLGVDRRRIAVGGISAGAGLAIGLALLARDRGGPNPAWVLAPHAQLDDRHVTYSSRALGDPRLWDATINGRAWAAYLRDVGDDVPAYAAPARAVDLTGLAPTFLLVGGLDCFRDENLELAARLLAAGVAVELHVYPGAYHCFDRIAPDATLSRAAQAALDAALARFCGDR